VLVDEPVEVVEAPVVQRVEVGAVDVFEVAARGPVPSA
jgi:hypothetical protein